MDQNQQGQVIKALTRMHILGLVFIVLFVGATGWALYERDGRLAAEKQVREQQVTIDGLVSPVLELTAMPCAKNDMVNLGGDNGFAIGGVWMPNSTPKSRLIATKPECRLATPKG